MLLGTITIQYMEADDNYASREFARAIASQYRRLLFKLLCNSQVFH